MRAARASTWRLVALAAIIGVASAACTLVSGWSDLQGGKRSDARDGGAGRDGAATDDDGGADASSEADSGLENITNVTCGAAHCPTGMGCCADFNDALSCTTRAACPMDQNQFLTCSSPASCGPTAPLCCADFSEMGARCRAACGAGQQELCNPTDSKPCSAGKACTGTLNGVRTVPACQ